MGDLSELMASVTEKGIIEPLVVRQRLGRYELALSKTFSARTSRRLKRLRRFFNFSRSADTRMRTWRGSWGSPERPSPSLFTRRDACGGPKSLSAGRHYR